MNDLSDDLPEDPSRVITCHGTADFLAALPQLTGFTAQGSLFVVLFAEARAGRAVRMDLPEPDDPRTTAQLLELVVDILRTSGAVGRSGSAPAIVISSAHTFAAAGGVPWVRLARRIERRLRRERIGIRELCCLAPDGWASYLEPDPPSAGHPLSDIATSPVALEASVHGPPVPRLSELGAIPTPDGRRARAVDRALAALTPVPAPAHMPAAPSPGSDSDVDSATESLPSPGAGPGLRGYDVPQWFHDTATATRALRSEGPGLSAAATAAVIHAAAHPDRWLLIALGILTRPEFPAELARDMSARPFTDVAVDLDADPQTAARPGWSIRRVLASICPEFTDHARLHTIRTRLLTVISESPAPERPALLALSAWVWWLGGNQTVAQRHVRAALDEAPEHELARMVDRIVRVPLYAGILAASLRGAASAA